MSEYVTCPSCGQEMTKAAFESQHKFQCPRSEPRVLSYLQMVEALERKAQWTDKLVREGMTIEHKEVIKPETPIDWIGMSEMMVNLLNQIDLNFQPQTEEERRKIQRARESLIKASKSFLDLASSVQEVG